MTDIFVSYAREDRERVERLVAALEARGWSVWWDPTIAVGSDYARAIEAALRSSRVVLVVWSARSVESHWVREEAAMGHSAGALVPVRIDAVVPPIGFQSLQTADLVAWEEAATPESEKLMADLGALLDSAEPVAQIGGQDASEPPRRRGPDVPASAGSPSSGSRRALMVLALVALALVAALWALRSRDGSVEAPVEPVAEIRAGTGLAILPFENQTGSSQLAYIGSGLSASLVTGLSGMPGVNVVGRARVRSALADGKAPAEAAEALGVNLLVEGDVYSRGDEVSVDVAVAEATSGSVLWAERFSAPREDLFTLQNEIQRALARVLSLPLSGADRQRLRSLSAGGPSAQAFDTYLQGLERLDDTSNPRHAEFAADLFRQAIRIDGGFAVFHAALSDAISTQHYAGLATADLDEARAEAELALELDPGLAQAHVALARAMRGQGQYAESVAALRPVLSEHPKPDEAFRELAFGYEATGDVDAARECYRTATSLAPENWFNWNALGAFQALQGDLSGAEESLTRAMELAPEGVAWPGLNLGGVKLILGDSAGAVEAFESTGAVTWSPWVASNMATAYYFEGRLDEAVELYQRSVTLDPDGHVWRRNLGDALLALDRHDEAVAAYREAFRLADLDVAANPRDNAHLSARALYAAKAKDCPRAVELATEARPLLAEGWSDHLHLAMAFALCGEAEPALGELELVVAGGYPAGALAQQAELGALSEEPGFLELTASRGDN